jgi:GNAT superfamily N-acetyltransferase
MDAARYSLRGIEETDYEAWASLGARIYPDHPISADVLRRLVEGTDVLGDPLPRLAVEERSSGELVAVGGLERNPYQWEPTRPWIFGDVHPEHRNRGIGSRLYEVVVDAARHRGATGLRATAREDDAAGLGFLVRRGFVERRRSWRSVLEVGSSDTSHLPALRAALSTQGIELTTLDREGASDVSVLRAVHELGVEAGRDMPRVGRYTPISFDEFQRFEVGGSSYLPEAWILAKRGERYVGLTSAYREAAQPDVLQQAFTGTLPEYRRRKIAEALKLSLHDYARSHGYARIITSNDSMNEAMWSLNRRLGFRKTGVRIHMELSFDPAATT